MALVGGILLARAAGFVPVSAASFVRVAVAATAGAAVALIPGIPVVLDLVLATVVYFAVLLALNGIPKELLVELKGLSPRIGRLLRSSRQVAGPGARHSAARPAARQVL